MKDKDGIVRIFSLHIREILERADLEFEKLQEIRLRAMGPLAIRYAGEEFFLKENGKIGREPEGAWMVTGREIQETMEFVGKYSLYAYEDELRQGFLTLRGGHRVGVAGRAVLEGDKVRSIRNISFLNVRLSHQIKGCADKALPFVCKGEEVRHTLIISPPRCGKTTLLRDILDSAASY